MTDVVSSAAEILGRERKAFEARTPRSGERFRRALDVFPGGDTRFATNFEPYPATIERAEGIELVDLDGNEYSDFLLNYTSLITGHRHPEVMAVAVEAISRMTGVAAPMPGQIELAEELIRRVQSVERLRFTNSGAESTLLSIWAARAFTARPTVIKSIGGYHGCVPELDGAFGRMRSLPVCQRSLRSTLCRSTIRTPYGQRSRMQATRLPPSCWSPCSALAA